MTPTEIATHLMLKLEELSTKHQINTVNAITAVNLVLVSVIRGQIKQEIEGEKNGKASELKNH